MVTKQMYSTPLRIWLATTALCSLCLAQSWEAGVVGGYGWFHNPEITNPTNTGRAGLSPRGIIGVELGENPYNHLGGEFRWLFGFEGPELKSNGTMESAAGYTNTFTYDFVFHLAPRETRIRAFAAAGAGIKVYTGSFRDVTQPLIELAALRPVSQVEPAISVGGGVKYLLRHHVQLHVDLHLLVTPLPDEVIRPIGVSTRIHGWVYGLVPVGGISYAF